MQRISPWMTTSILWSIAAGSTGDSRGSTSKEMTTTRAALLRRAREFPIHQTSQASPLFWSIPQKDATEETIPTKNRGNSNPLKYEKIETIFRQPNGGGNRDFRISPWTTASSSFKRRHTRPGSRTPQTSSQIDQDSQRQKKIKSSERNLYLHSKSTLICMILQQDNPIRSMKMNNIMEFPPVALLSGLDCITRQVHYPEQHLRLWKECPPPKSPVEGSARRDRDRPSPSRTQGILSHDAGFEEVENGRDSRAFDASIEKLRANLDNVEFQGVGDNVEFATPGSSGQSTPSVQGSGSGHRSFLPLEPEVRLASTRSKKRQRSSSHNSLGNLDPVEEDAPFEPFTHGYDLNGTQLVEETAPAQTPKPEVCDPTVEKITQSIRTHLKTHFDTPGAPQYESMNILASGMNKKRAAQLFYQTCVLATCDFVKVQQIVPYGDITISRGSKM